MRIDLEVIDYRSHNYAVEFLETNKTTMNEFKAQKILSQTARNWDMYVNTTNIENRKLKLPLNALLLSPVI